MYIYIHLCVCNALPYLTAQYHLSQCIVHCNMPLPAAIYTNPLEHIATFGTTLQHPLPSDCTVPLLSYPPFPLFFFDFISTDGACCSVLQYAATCCSVLYASRLLAWELMVRQVAIYIHTLLHSAHSNSPQPVIARCDPLSHIAASNNMQIPNATPINVLRHFFFLFFLALFFSHQCDFAHEIAAILSSLSPAARPFFCS